MNTVTALFAFIPGTKFLRRPAFGFPDGLNGVPVLVVRAVFDPMEQTLPPFVAESLHSSRSKTAMRAAAFTLSHPTSIRLTMRLRTQAGQATASLSRFLMNLVPGSKPSPSEALAGAR